MSFTLICLRLMLLLSVVVSIIPVPFYNYSAISITCSPTYNCSNFSVLSLFHKMKNGHMVVQSAIQGFIFFDASVLPTKLLHLFKKICKFCHFASVFKVIVHTNYQVIIFSPSQIAPIPYGCFSSKWEVLKKVYAAAFFNTMEINGD